MLVNLVQNGAYQFLIRALEEQIDDEILIPSLVQTLVIGKQTDFIYEFQTPKFWSKVLNALLASANYNLIGEVLTQLPASLSLALLNDAIARQLPADILRKIKQGSSASAPVYNYFLDFYLGDYEQVLKSYKVSNTSNLTESEWVCIISTLIDTGNFDEAVHIIKSNNFSDTYAIEKLRLLAIAHHGANNPELARAAIDGAISQGLTQFGSYHFKTAELLNLSGLLGLAQEEFERAESALIRALSVFEKSKGKSNFEFVSSTGNLALVAYHSGRLNEAIGIWLEVIDLLTYIGMEQHPETALVQKNLAFAYYEAKNLEQAKHFTQQALQIFTASGMQQTTSYSDCQNLLEEINSQ
jgi:tetratricopeptide (TPR) repeat protein